MFKLGSKPLIEIRTDIHKDRFLASPVVRFCFKPPSNSVPFLGAVFLLLFLVTQQIRGRNPELTINVRSQNYLDEARFITVQIDVVPVITTCWVDLDLIQNILNVH